MRNRSKIESARARLHLERREEGEKGGSVWCDVWRARRFEHSDEREASRPSNSEGWRVFLCVFARVLLVGDQEKKGGRVCPLRAAMLQQQRWRGPTSSTAGAGRNRGSRKGKAGRLRGGREAKE